MKCPGATSVRLGMRDGMAGLLPVYEDNRYYMSGYRRGRATLLGREEP